MGQQSWKKGRKVICPRQHNLLIAELVLESDSLSFYSTAYPLLFFCYFFPKLVSLFFISFVFHSLFILYLSWMLLISPLYFFFLFNYVNFCNPEIVDLPGNLGMRRCWQRHQQMYQVLQTLLPQNCRTVLLFSN